MSGWKDWQIGEVVTEGDFQSLVQDQVVQRYADATARDTTLGANVAEGMVAYLDDTNAVQVYNGSAWIPVGEGDITAVTAGTALTGGGTSGDVTLNVDLSAVTIPTSQISDITATAAALNTIDDGTSGFTALSNGTAGISYQPVSHNYIINGAFDNWQRGDGPFTANGYTTDRWFMDFFGATSSVEKQSFTAGELDAAGFGSGQSYVRIASTSATANSDRFDQKIEDVRTLAGQTVTVSFFAEMDSTKNIRLDMAQNFGSGGSAKSFFLTNQISIGTTWQRYEVTVDVPSVSGKTIGANSFLEIRFVKVEAETFTFNLWGVQLEAGSVATPFKRHAPSLALEERACKWFYRRLDSSSAAFATFANGQASGTTNGSYTLYTGPMRARPTVTTPDATKLAASGSTFGTLAGTGFTVNTARQSSDACLFQLTVASGLAAGNATTLMANNNLDAVIEMNAEL